MRHFVLKLMIVSAVILLTACASDKNYQLTLQSWKGANEQQLFNVWGYPNKIRLVAGRKLLVYHTVRKGTYPTYSTPGYSSVNATGGTTTVNTVSSTTSGGGSYDFRCTTWFRVSKAGRILSSSFRGNGCAAGKGFAKKYRLHKG